jgi:23S rRNA pseudouridine1911/1915/1917 synthase
MRFTDETAEVIEFIAEETGLRLDVLLASVSGRSRSFAAEVIEEGLVELNGRIPSKSVKVKKGDQVRMEIPIEEVPSLEPQPVDFGVIYEDKDLIVVDKPAGVTVHPAPGSPDRTLVNGLLYRYKIEDHNDFRPGIVHRLDRDTSGLILVARNRDAREKLSGLFAERSIDKRYLAFCWGEAKFDSLIVEEPIGRHHTDRKKMTVREDGRYAKTMFVVRERYKNAFLAEVKIWTGRTHQIRVHANHIGHPIIDDQLYGGKHNRGFKIERQALHSWKLSFCSPFAQNKCEFLAPMPAEMELLRERLLLRK